MDARLNSCNRIILQLNEIGLKWYLFDYPFIINTKQF